MTVAGGKDEGLSPVAVLVASSEDKLCLMILATVPGQLSFQPGSLDLPESVWATHNHAWFLLLLTENPD